MSYPNFVRGLSFANIASQIKLLDTKYRAKQMIIQCFDQGCENTQRGGQKGHFKAFSEPWLAQASLWLVWPPNNFMVK